MASKDRVFLNGKWIDGYIPTGTDYTELFESFYNVTDDSNKFSVRQIGVSVDGLGSAIQTGSLGFSVPAFTGTIQSWSLVGDQSGSVVIDVKRSGVSIIGAGNSPTITSATSSTANVSGWTSTSITEGDFIEYSITSVSSFTRLNLFIKILLT